MAYLKIVSNKPKKKMVSYKFYPKTIERLEKISKQQNKSMTTVLEYLIDNFDNLVLKDDCDCRKTNVK